MLVWSTVAVMTGETQTDCRALYPHTLSTPTATTNNNDADSTLWSVDTAQMSIETTAAVRDSCFGHSNVTPLPRVDDIITCVKIVHTQSTTSKTRKEQQCRNLSAAAGCRLALTTWVERSTATWPHTHAAAGLVARVPFFFLSVLTLPV